jgi:uncharacterized protein YcsI (UPF0317 family)
VTFANGGGDIGVYVPVIAAVHGGPVHIGSPAALGIADLDKPDWGEPVQMEPDDVPMFWACGVTRNRQRWRRRRTS